MHNFPALRERGKDVETYTKFSDFNYSESEIQCRRHPNPSPVGVCPRCLKERLMKLVCSECEQCLSLCSCSDDSSSLYRNSCSKMEIGSVGRISFLLENQKAGFRQHSMSNFLRRSSSSCVEIKKNNGFWNIKRLFRKKKHKGYVKDGEFDPNRGVFAVKESDFCAMDESEFFDLKLDLLSESKQDLSGYDQGIRCKSVSLENGGSCKMDLNERKSRSGRRNGFLSINMLLRRKITF
ncbi:hypothetical protein CDL12_13947 [Handroanthus impetiginosus]|uniref:Uncharacterized protein n=1 Tax=Handroanthus impetiginosus TaxID=429701 RepID=A0A2G9H7C0_9LAMI|nr:hypothetical protein CDL12_13947 [Handroanthus impetiginosus]